MSVAVMVPCYKRPEYTLACIKAIREAQEYTDTHFFLIDDGSCDETEEILRNSGLSAHITINPTSSGLRNCIIDFFEWVTKLHKVTPIDYITKIDNDCVVPPNWLNDLTKIFEDAGADVISPNVSETNAAHKYGAIHLRKGPFIPSEIVGGLWFMKREMIEDIFFERVQVGGIRAAFHIINQIVVEKSPKIGWTDAITYQDIGYWNGSHPCHIKSKAHEDYSKEIGRRIAWRSQDELSV